MGSLNDELKNRNSDVANALHMRVALARRAVARSSEHGVATPAYPTAWLRAFLSTRKLTRPERQPLYRYRMTDSEYVSAREIVRTLAAVDRLPGADRDSAALFVAYCAEWFRRESQTTFLKWNDPAPDVFANVNYEIKQVLARTGLAYWRRPLRVSEHATEYLLTVALEGGFPVRLLAEGARGWLKDYLRAIMRRAILSKMDSRQQILALAKEEQGRMRKSYRHEDFIELCCEVADQLIDLRRRAEAKAVPGVSNSVLLDGAFPGWRDELPIYLPGDDEKLVDELLTGLLDEKISDLATEGVEIKRFLVKQGGEWRSALQLLADGEIAAAKVGWRPTEGRMRAIATGELATRLADEVALFEPPAAEGGRWRVRPFARVGRLLVDFPFSAPATVALTSSTGVHSAWTWPKGEALRSDVLVFREDEAANTQEPRLSFVRSGSAGSSAKTLFALIPQDWIAKPRDELTELEIEPVPALARQLVRVTSAVYVCAPEPDAPRYRIEADSESREEDLYLPAPCESGFALADENMEPVLAPTKDIQITTGKLTRTPQAQELFVRWPGGRWAAIGQTLSGAGAAEISWRDTAANIQREKRKIALLPLRARIEAKMLDARRGEIRLHGLEGWTATACEPNCWAISEGPTLTVEFAGKPVYRLRVALRPPAGAPVEVIVPIISHEASIALADGSLMSAGDAMDVGALRGAVATASQRATLQVAVRGARDVVAKARIDGETPLGLFRSAIEEAFASRGEQDVVVEITFVGDSRRPHQVQRYRQPQLTRCAEGVRWRALAAAAAWPVARMILDPRHEHALEPGPDGIWTIPERCRGPCLVYLRDGIDVASRPTFVMRPGVPGEGDYSGRLVEALVTADYDQRQAAIDDTLAGLESAQGAPGDLNWLIDAASLRNGLPAIAFDALRLLSGHPRALIRLLVWAPDAEKRAAVWSLQNELPFLWLALPVEAWGLEVKRFLFALSERLTEVFGEAKAREHALATVLSICDGLEALEPALATLFAAVHIPRISPRDFPRLEELVNGYIREQHDREEQAPNDFAVRLTAKGLKLPPEIQTKSHEWFAGLFAPALLAASARRQWPLEGANLMLVRRALRESPAFVTAAWRHLLQFYG